MYMIDCALMKEFKMKPSFLEGATLKDLYTEQKYLLALLLGNNISFSSVEKAIFINEKEIEFNKIFDESISKRSVLKSMAKSLEKDKMQSIIEKIKEQEKKSYLEKKVKERYGFDNA